VSNAFLVRRFERIANLHGIFQRLIHRQRPCERRALDVLHHQVVRSNIVQRTDVGVIQRRDRLGFALKAFRELFVGNLDGNRAIQARIAGLVDLSHPASADGRGNLVGTQPSSGSQGHKSNDCTAQDMGREWSAK
jgi:hypothetical protein